MYISVNLCIFMQYLFTNTQSTQSLLLKIIFLNKNISEMIRRTRCKTTPAPVQNGPPLYFVAYLMFKNFVLNVLTLMFL